VRYAHQSDGIERLSRSIEQDHRSEAARPATADAVEVFHRTFIGNQLLVRLSDTARAELAPLLQRVELPAGAAIGAADANGREQCFFLTSGLASCALIDRRRERIEVAVVGCESAIGLSAFAARDGQMRIRMLAPGSALKIGCADLARLTGRSAEIAALARAAVADFLQQSTGNLLAAARYGVEQRVARWLLIATERARLDALPVTHETIAMALGVRRAGVSLALNAQRAARAIECGRRTVTILDRPLLVEAAGGSYTAMGRERATP